MRACCVTQWASTTRKLVFFLGTGANLICGETRLYPAAIKIDKFEKFKGVVVKDEQSSSSREMTSGQHDGR